MFSQGMCPVFKVVPGQQNWERIRDKPSYNVMHINLKKKKHINYNNIIK